MSNNILDTLVAAVKEADEQDGNKTTLVIFGHSADNNRAMGALVGDGLTVVRTIATVLTEQPEMIKYVEAGLAAANAFVAARKEVVKNNPNIN